MYETRLSSANCTGKGGCTFDWKGEGLSRRGFESGSKFFFFFFFFFCFFFTAQNAGIVRLGMCELVIS